MMARALLGIVVGGFWSLATATVMRLVPEQAVPKALGNCGICHSGIHQVRNEWAAAGNSKVVRYRFAIDFASGKKA